MRALICGISGQDGAYLASLLLDKDYEVFGTSRDAQIGSFANLASLGIRDRVRLTLQPFDGPEDDASVMRLMEHIGSDEMLLFSTDYPHWQFEGEAAMPAGFDATLAKKMMADNPLRTYPRLQPQTATRETAS